MNELLIVQVLTALPARLSRMLLRFLTKVLREAAAVPDLRRGLRNTQLSRDQYKRDFSDMLLQRDALSRDNQRLLDEKAQLYADYKHQWDELHALKADGESARTLLTRMQTNPQLRVGLDAIVLQVCVRNNWQVIQSIKELRTLFSCEGRTYFTLMNAKDVVEACREQCNPKVQA